MKQRNPAAVFLLALITFGIYGIYWEVKTKGELKQQGADIPTAWLIIIPLANLYWLWKYALGVEQVSKGKISAVLVLILMLLLSIVGMAILQSEFNKLGEAPAGGALPPTPPAGPTPPSDPTPPTVTPPANPEPPVPPAAPPTV